MTLKPSAKHVSVCGQAEVPHAVDSSHLDALRLNLSRERSRLTLAGTESERALRAVWVAQLERELAGEVAFLGVSDDVSDIELSDDDLLAALKG